MQTILTACLAGMMLSAWWLLNCGFSLLLNLSFLENCLPGDWPARLYAEDAVSRDRCIGLHILPSIALSYLARRSMFYRR